MLLPELNADSEGDIVLVKVRLLLPVAEGVLMMGIGQPVGDADADAVTDAEGLTD